MSEDDRAAKAARAKAMLKKRQAKKGGPAAATSPGVASPTSERAFSPAPPEQPVDEEKRDLGDLFSKDDTTEPTSWLSSLTRVETSPPPPTHNIPAGSGSNGNDVHQLLSSLQAENESLKREVESLGAAKIELQQLQDSLRSDHAALKAQINELQSANSKLQTDEKSLTSERDTMKGQLSQLESQLQATEASLNSENAKLRDSLAKLEASNIQFDHTVASLKSERSSLEDKFRGELENINSQLQQVQTALQVEQARSEQLQEQITHLETEKENSQQTISLLVSEKAALVSDLERFSDVESKAEDLERLLSEEQTKTGSLEQHVEQLRSEIRDATARTERQLQLANASVTSLRNESEKHQRRVKELEEQIESDDRAERLEVSLKNTQERADELEFQLSKLKQIHADLKKERDDIQSKLQTQDDQGKHWEVQHSKLHEQYVSIQQQLSDVISEKDALIEEKSSRQLEIDNTQKALSLLQEKLSQAANELASNTRQLQTAHNEAKIAMRRAEDAERMQKDLQTEGTNLMRSLDEMRPKVVELTDQKLELTEKVDELERVISGYENNISELEASLEDAHQEKEALDNHWKQVISEREKDKTSALDSSTELQKAYSDLQEELNSALASVKTLDADRTRHQQEAARYLQELEDLNERSAAQKDELLKLRQELAQRSTEQEEEQDFLERAQNEIETLRQELSSKEEELQRLRSPIRTEAPRSLDDEILSSVKQQHSLELSTAQSQIRSLETALFDAEARSHTLTKQIAGLEDQLAARPPVRSFSPGIPSRPSSRGARNVAEQRPYKPSALSRPAFEQNLSPETRHKRKTSLSMLKARMDSELAVAAAKANVTSSPNSRALSPVSELSSEKLNRSMSNLPHVIRPQFLDDSHIFWCSSCRGDLVIL
ncbi:hypothetical protein D9758_000538 [Tetrapyrgos nigripes]|uniref:Uncharacterized protein n=1 Tax=Tetrapyrgos nigripes TaxID=182062 RepID=A0A8H5H1H6_9AGAR|nr:hypothetical protein D9758_000538 [Tetrapyrgos nigripes]